MGHVTNVPLAAGGRVELRFMHAASGGALPEQPHPVDVYIATAAVAALGEIGTPEALAFLDTLGDHPAQMVRAAARRIVEGSHAQETR